LSFLFPFFFPSTGLPSDGTGVDLDFSFSFSEGGRVGRARQLPLLFHFSPPSTKWGLRSSGRSIFSFFLCSALAGMVRRAAARSRTIPFPPFPSLPLFLFFLIGTDGVSSELEYGNAVRFHCRCPFPLSPPFFFSFFRRSSASRKRDWATAD